MKTKTYSVPAKGQTPREHGNERAEEIMQQLAKIRDWVEVHTPGDFDFIGGDTKGVKFDWSHAGSMGRLSHDLADILEYIEG